MASTGDVRAQELRRRVFGNVTGASESTARCMTTQSGLAGARSLKKVTQSGSAGATPLKSVTQSGSGREAVVTSTMTLPPQSGLAATISLTSASPSGSVEVGGRVGSVSRQKGSRKTRRVESELLVEPSCNSWNEFQRANSGKHWGIEKMRAEYYKMKSQKR